MTLAGTVGEEAAADASERAAVDRTLDLKTEKKESHPEEGLRWRARCVERHTDLDVAHAWL